MEDDTGSFPGATLRDSVYFNLRISELWKTPDQYLLLRPAALAIEIPMGPITNIASITYIDTEGNQQLLDPAAYEQIPTDNGNLRISPPSVKDGPARNTVWERSLSIFLLE